MADPVRSERLADQLDDGASRRPIDVTVVGSAACHFCADARDVLDDVASRYTLRVRHLDAEDPDGRALLAAHRVGMLPLVLLDGAFFSAGRLPRRKLDKALSERAGGRPGVGGAVR